MAKKLTLGKVRELIKAGGYTLLSQEYINAHDKLEIQCPQEHVYRATWGAFQQGRRCPQCAWERNRNDFESVKQYIEQYQYKVLSQQYINTHTKLSLQCPAGHIFQMTYADFQQGYRCSNCQKHRYTFSEVKEYIENQGYKLLSSSWSSQNKIDIQCPRGHQYKTYFVRFKSGLRCPYCAGKGRTHVEAQRFIEKQGYVIISGTYEGVTSKFILQCPNGHQYKTVWKNFYRGSRCEKCQQKEYHDNFAVHVRKTLEAQGCELLSLYEKSNIKIKVRCPKQHVYEMRWNDIQSGHGCPYCVHLQSKGEKDICTYYEVYGIIERSRTIISPLELDIYFPKQKISIEYCGLYWHSDIQERMTPGYHRNKLDLCAKQNIRLLTIFSDEWVNHKDICISRINSALNIIKDKIHARKCISKQIDKKEARQFLQQTHLQGPGSCKVAYGLFYNNELVQVMTFGSPARAHTTKGKRVLEMKRLSGKLNTVIIGGASKLFKLGLQYAKNNNYEIIKSYCDLRWGTGNLYKQLGFTLIYDSKYTPHYTDGISRWRNQNLAQNKAKTGITEAEKAKQKGLYKIYDCGHQTWEYEVANI